MSSHEIDGANEGINVEVNDVDGSAVCVDDGIAVGYNDVNGSADGHPTPKMVDSLLPKLPPPSRLSSLL